MIPMIVLCGIGLVMASLLAVGRKAFAVEVDPRQERIDEILPGVNCGGCGFPGCSGFAAALVDGKASPTDCAPGGADLATELGKILGVEVEITEPMVALVACAGTDTASPPLAGYIGEMTCAAAHAVPGAGKACTRGCLGLGTLHWHHCRRHWRRRCRLGNSASPSPGDVALLVPGEERSPGEASPSVG